MSEATLDPKLLRLTFEGWSGMLTGQEEGVVRISRRMLLWLEEGVKIPEAALHVIVGGHLLEAHLDENLPELTAHLKTQAWNPV